jgi:tetratricopeptide (TPR) repeat protein
MNWRILTLLMLLATLGCGGKAGPKQKSLTDQYTAALKQPDAVVRSKELTKVAEKQNKAGDGLAAQTSLASAAVAAKEVTDPSSRATCLNTVAAAMCRLDQISDAKPLFSEAARAIDEIKDVDAKITPLTSLATSTASYLKNPDLAAEYLKKGEAAAEAISNPMIKAQALGRIATTYSKLPKEEDTKRVSDKALEFARSQPGAKEKSDTLAEVAAQLHLMKKATEAQATFDEAQKEADKVESQDGKANAYLHLAKKLKEAGQKEPAKGLLTKAENIADKLKDASLRGPLKTEIEQARKGL